MPDSDLFPIEPISKTKQREDFFNSLRDWQWECHLEECKQHLTTGTIKPKKKNSIPFVDNIVEEITSEVRNRVNNDLNNISREVTNRVLNQNNGQNNEGGDIQLINTLARVVLNNNNVISRERETASTIRRFLAASFDWIFLLSQMLIWVVVLHLNNIYIMPNLSRFIKQDLSEIVREFDQMTEDHFIKSGDDGLFNSYTSLDLDMDLVTKVLSRANLNGIEDDIILFTILFKIMGVLYETTFIFMWGSTVGKYIFNMEVVHFSSFVQGRNTPDIMIAYDTRLSIPRSLLRSVVKMLYFTVAFPILLFMMPFNQRPTLVYDTLTKTMVVKRR